MRGSLKRALLVAVAGVVGGLGLVVQARPIVVSPIDSEDAFVYQFIAGGNFVAPPFGPPPASFNTILTTGKRLGHDTETLIRFPLDGISMEAGQDAFLSLWVTNNEPVSPFAPTFGESPSPAIPAPTSVFAAAGPWTAMTVSWGSRPPLGPLLDTELIDGIDRWVTWNVTSQVMAWVNDPVNHPNFGFHIIQDVPLRNADDTASIFVVYHSSRNVNRPRLIISPRIIPEPMALWVVGAASGLLLRRRAS